MDTFSLLNSFVKGGVFLVLFFIFCFFTVHIAKLAKRGYEQTVRLKKDGEAKQEAPEQQKQPEQKKSPEPVYYIVEKKKKRPKSEYSNPKEIRFK